MELDGLEKAKSVAKFGGLVVRARVQHFHGGTDCGIGRVFLPVRNPCHESFPVQDMTKRRSKCEEICSAWHLEVSLVSLVFLLVVEDVSSVDHCRSVLFLHSPCVSCLPPCG